jgi:filamin
MNSDPTKVIVTGDGLKFGVFGEEIKAVIDTRGAGAGELTANCTGPQKVAFCEFFDHKDGTFTVYVKPQEPGKHVLQIRYNGEHVPGSPFVVKISGPPDASKVKIAGPGIYDGVLSTFKSRFACDTKGAGAGQLTVRIRGPKGFFSYTLFLFFDLLKSINFVFCHIGGFRVEMQRENPKDRTILCKYDPTEVINFFSDNSICTYNVTVLS